MAVRLRSHMVGAVLNAGALLGVFLLLQGVVTAVSARESLLFLVWSAPRSLSIPLALGAGLGLLWTRFAPRREPSEDGESTSMVTKLGRFVWLLVVPGVSWALWDAVQVWRLGLRSPNVDLDGLGWVPTSVVIAAALALPVVLARGNGEGESRPGWSARLGRWAAAGVLLLLVLLHAVLATGRTDYQRKGDVAVVLGARAYRNLTPSDALRDRIMTGVQLYKQGRVKRLLMTGGMSGGNVSEPLVMRKFAAERGVPKRSIILDEEGDNTAASIRNLVALKRAHKFGRILIVSHDYHTLRLKMSCHRLGLTCYTVPAEQQYRLSAEPYYVARELAAVLHYAAFFR